MHTFGQIFRFFYYIRVHTPVNFLNSSYYKQELFITAITKTVKFTLL